MEHITLFLREEGEEEDQSLKPAMPTTRSPPEKSPYPPSSSSHSSQSQSPDIELQAKGHVCATQVKVSTPTVGCFNPGFVPIQPVRTFPLHSPVSSGTLPTGLPQHQCATRAEMAPLMLNEPYDNAGRVLKPWCQLNSEHETLALRTVRPDTTHLSGFKVTFEISPRDNPKKRYKVLGAFTTSGLDLVEQSYPVQTLQRKYEHLRGIPLQPFHKVCPMVLIGSDQVHLITAKEPIRQGTKGGPMAVRTALGWALQGPEMSISDHAPVQQCFFITTAYPDDLLYRNVERLWQLDVLPFCNEKLVVRSKQDKEAMHLLESQTQRLTVDGVQRYATPLLWK